MKLTSLILALALAPNGYAQDDTFDEGPAWTAGGHYTAELDLAAGTLTLMPLADAKDTVLQVGTCAQNDIEPGIYVLRGTGDQWRLLATNPRGVAARTGPESYTPVDCASRSQVAELGLPAGTLEKLVANNVGAVYIHAGNGVEHAR